MLLTVRNSIWPSILPCFVFILSCHGSIHGMSLEAVAVDLMYWDEWCVRGEGDVSPGHVGNSPGEMSHGWMWCVLSLSRTIQGTSCCCESHYKPRTRLRTCLLVYRPTVPRPDIHTHTHTHGSVTSLSSILFSVCSLSTVVIVNTTSHLPFVYSNNKAIRTLFESLNKEIWLTFLLLLLLFFVVALSQSVLLPSISHCAQIWQALPKNQLLT